MIWRIGLLSLSVLVALGASGAAWGGTHASAWRVTAAAAVLLLAPLFWPGRGPAAWRRVAGWSLAGAAVAVAATFAFGPAGRWDAVALVALQLLVLLLLAHALCAGLESPLGGPGPAGASVALLLALAGALPVWAGPVGLGTEGGGLDALLAASPLTHLAVASGNDLLRNPWLYENTPLGGLPAEYPAGTTLVAAYAAGLAALAALAWRRGAFTASVPLETSP